MYHLTPDQYDVFYLAALNVLSAFDEKRDSEAYIDQLMACAAALTGHYPDQATTQNVIDMAKADPDIRRKSVEATIRRLIGDFTYDKQFWKDRSISKAEVEALVGHSID